jgi:hypothetical protein
LVLLLLLLRPTCHWLVLLLLLDCVRLLLSLC